MVYETRGYDTTIVYDYKEYPDAITGAAITAIIRCLNFGEGRRFPTRVPSVRYEKKHIKSLRHWFSGVFFIYKTSSHSHHTNFSLFYNIMQAS